MSIPRYHFLVSVLYVVVGDSVISGDEGSGVPGMTWRGKESGYSPNCSCVVSSSGSWEVLGKGGGSCGVSGSDR
jgi:hypothetical protein